MPSQSCDPSSYPHPRNVLALVSLPLAVVQIVASSVTITRLAESQSSKVPCYVCSGALAFSVVTGALGLFPVLSRQAKGNTRFQTYLHEHGGAVCVVCAGAIMSLPVAQVLVCNIQWCGVRLKVTQAPLDNKGVNSLRRLCFLSAFGENLPQLAALIWVRVLHGEAVVDLSLGITIALHVLDLLYLVIAGYVAFLVHHPANTTEVEISGLSEIQDGMHAYAPHMPNRLASRCVLKVSFVSIGLVLIVLAIACVSVLRFPDGTTTTTTTTAPSIPSTPHYEDPKNGCQADEVEIQIQGTSGDVCAPTCSLLKPCPTGVPIGVTGHPQCALQSSVTGQKYCVVLCESQSEDDQCGENASCKSLQQNIGVCTYDD